MGDIAQTDTSIEQSILDQIRSYADRANENEAELIERIKAAHLKSTGRPLDAAGKDIAYAFLAEKVGHLNAQHLQPDDGQLRKLTALGHQTIADVTSASLNGVLPMDIQKNLDLLAANIRNGRVDWYGFWADNDFVFKRNAMTCDEFAMLDETVLDSAVTPEWYGSSAEIFAKNGYETIGQVISDLEAAHFCVSGFGRRKQALLAKALVGLAKDIRAGRTPVIPGQRRGRKPEAILFSFPEVLDDLSVGVLRISTKEAILNKSGIHTLGDLRKAGSEKLNAIRGVGQSTIDQMTLSMSCLASAVRSDGSVDWSAYCGTELTLFPALDGTESASDMLKFVEDMRGFVAPLLAHGKANAPIIERIVSERIMKPYSARLTLNELSGTGDVKITRERVRQMEEAVLSDLNGALIHNSQNIHSLHIHPGFISFWKHLASFFDHEDGEKTFMTCIEPMLGEFGWQYEEVAHILPFITSVIMLDTNTPMQRDSIEKFPVFVMEDHEDLKKVFLSKLHIGGMAKRLRKKGLRTIGDVSEMVRWGELDTISNGLQSLLCRHLKMLETCRDTQTGEVDWEAYAKLCGVSIVGARNGWEDIIDHLHVDCAALLRKSSAKARAQEVFLERTSRHPSDRPTSEDLASRFDSYGSTIKRIETESLLFLNHVIFQENNARAGAHIDEIWMEFWSHAKEAFDSSRGDVYRFQSRLAKILDVDADRILQALPTLIAVLSGYPLYNHHFLSVVSVHKSAL